MRYSVAEVRVVVAVKLDRVADLSDADRAAVRDLSLAVYPPEELIDWPGREVEWSTPEWAVRIWEENAELVSYVGVYVREAEFDGRSVRVGGIGNVKTHPAARGRGLARLGIRQFYIFLAAPILSHGRYRFGEA